MKILLLPLLGLFMYTGLTAQDGIVLRMKYLPEHIYEVTTITQMLMEMNMESGEGFPGGEDELPEGPLLMQMDQWVVGTINTGKTAENGNIPLQMHLDQKTKVATPYLEMGELPQEEAMQFSMAGYAESNGVVRILTVEGVELPEEAMEAVSELISNISTQVQFPDQPLRIGDSFTQEIPFNLPLDEMGVMNMFIVADYTLVDIDGHLAMLEVVQTLEMDASEMGFTIRATGGGSGTLTLDTSLEYVTASRILFTMEMILDMGEMRMTNAMESEIIQSVEITKL